MRTYILLLAVALLPACKKEKPANLHGDPTIAGASCGDVTGITRRDVNGAPIGAADPDDWNWSDDWCPTEEYQFQGRPAVTWSTTTPDSLVIACYPNPNNGEFWLGFFRDDSSYVDIRIVDDEFQYVGGFDSLTSPLYVLNVASMGVTEPGILRVLYRVVHTDGTAHRGHGDVQVDP